MPRVVTDEKSSRPLLGPCHCQAEAQPQQKEGCVDTRAECSLGNLAVKCKPSEAMQHQHHRTDERCCTELSQSESAKLSDVSCECSVQQQWVPLSTWPQQAHYHIIIRPSQWHTTPASICSGRCQPCKSRIAYGIAHSTAFLATTLGLWVTSGITSMTALPSRCVSRL